MAKYDNSDTSSNGPLNSVPERCFNLGCPGTNVPSLGRFCFTKALHIKGAKGRITVTDQEAAVCGGPKDMERKLTGEGSPKPPG